MLVQMAASLSAHPTPIVQAITGAPVAAPIEAELTPISISPTATFTLSPTLSGPASVKPTMIPIIVDNSVSGFTCDDGNHFEMEQGVQGSLALAFSRLD
jgi:hypothetical protein